MWGTWQRTAASASCRQPLRSASWKRHSPRDCSWPVHRTSLMWMGPRPEAGGRVSAPCFVPIMEQGGLPPSFPRLGVPYGNRAAHGRNSQGSPIPVQAGAAWTSQDAPAAPSKPGAFPIVPPKPSGTLSPCHATRLTLAHLGSHQGLLRCPVAQLPAHHAGRGQVPLLVTHGAPLPVAQHLHPALTGMGARSQSHWEHLGRGSRRSVAPGHGRLPAPRARGQSGWPATAQLQDPLSAGWGAGPCQGSPFLGRSCSCPCPCPSGR